VNTYGGATTISGGTLSITGTGQLGSGGIYAGAISDSGTLNLNATANQTLSGAISGSGAFISNNNGTVTLSGANSYSGLTSILQGTTIVSGTNSSAVGNRHAERRHVAAR